MDKVAPTVSPVYEMEGDFSCLNLSDVSPKKRIRTPRKILHFSDGTLEEYSTDEEQEETPIQKISVDPKALMWGPWVQYWAHHTGGSLISACDYVGEKVANFLGITSPKYFYEIEDYKRAQKLEEEEKKEIANQMAGWLAPQLDGEKTDQPEETFLGKDFYLLNDCRGAPISLDSKVPPLQVAEVSEDKGSKY